MFLSLFNKIDKNRTNITNEQYFSNNINYNDIAYYAGLFAKTW